MSIDELERDGWEQIDTFGFGCIIMARENQRMVVEKETGDIVITY